MDILRVTVIGKDLFKPVESICELVGLNPVNQVNSGMLGNLTLLTFQFELEEDEIIKKRKKLMEKLSEDCMHMMPMYVYGDWMRIFVMKPIRM